MIGPKASGRGPEASGGSGREASGALGPEASGGLRPEASGATGPEASGARGDRLREAAQVMRAVRERCVWTAQITHRDLVPYLIEESAELIDAVETGTRAELREELGDLLWQVLFHAEIAARDPDDPFDIDDVAAGLAGKMVRRHPHVFGDAVARTPDEVLVLWNAAKAAEKHERRSVLDGVSERMPSLALAQKLLARVAALPETARIAIPAENRRDAAIVDRDADSGIGAVDEPATEVELGDALLALVALARERGWDAERALRERLRALTDAVRDAEASVTGAAGESPGADAAAGVSSADPEVEASVAARDPEASVTGGAGESPGAEPAAEASAGDLEE